MSKVNQVEIRQKNFLTKWSQSSNNLSKVKTIKDVFLVKTPGLAEIKKEFGNDFMISYLSIWISKINSFAGGNMNSEDCKDTAASIFKDYYFLTIADLKLISKRMKLRKFIRVTGNEIYREIESYFNERSEIASNQSRSDSEGYKENFSVPDILADNIDKLKEGLTITKHPKKTRKEERSLNKQARLRYLKEKGKKK